MRDWSFQTGLPETPKLLKKNEESRVFPKSSVPSTYINHFAAVKSFLICKEIVHLTSIWVCFARPLVSYRQ